MGSFGFGPSGAAGVDVFEGTAGRFCLSQDSRHGGFPLLTRIKNKMPFMWSWVSIVAAGVMFATLGSTAAAEEPSPASAASLTSFSLTQPSALIGLASLSATDIDEVSLEEADTLRERQSIDAFTSLEDGQPGAPGEFELQFDFGWKTTSEESDPALFEPELKYTPNGNEFLRNAKFTLAAPMELGNGGFDGNADVEFGWQQRWVSEDGWLPTLATLAEVRIPSGYQSAGVDGTLTGIVAKDLGPGTLYFNAFAKTANGDNVEDLRHFQWGFRTGYKWRINPDVALIADYVHQASEQEGHSNINLLEVSGEWHIDEHLTIGPGISIGLDDNEETPNFGAGFRLTWSF